jgi:hypothetical protein
MTATIDATYLEELPTLSALPVQHLADMKVDLQAPQFVSSPVGDQLVFIVKSGRIEGPGISGDVLPGGGDWLRAGNDGIGRVDVRATIRTDDGALIGYTARGLIRVPADGLERLAAGERLSFAETYVRTTPKFETSDERYAWISTIVAIGYNLLSPNHVDYRIYKVL